MHRRLLQLQFISINHWDETLWQKVKKIYNEAFAGHGGKPEKIIHNMFNKHLCFLHVAFEDNEVIAMALTGLIKGPRILIIDYMAVKNDLRGRGIGKEFFSYIKEWAILQNVYNHILLEAESEQTPVNLDRIKFWETCGFNLVDEYIHHYIWVPEPYQAMVLNLRGGAQIAASGEILFTYIENFHKKSFR